MNDTARWLKPIDIRKKIIVWIGAIIVLILSIIIKQYAFTILWIVLVGFLFFAISINGKKMERDRIKNNPFAMGPFSLEFTDKSYLVCMGKTKLDLSFDQLGRVHEIADMFRLDHKSGVSISVPKRVLSEEELKSIKQLKSMVSGWPENKSPSDW